MVYILWHNIRILMHAIVRYILKLVQAYCHKGRELAFSTTHPTSTLHRLGCSAVIRWTPRTQALWFAPIPGSYGVGRIPAGNWTLQPGSRGPGTEPCLNEREAASSFHRAVTHRYNFSMSLHAFQPYLFYVTPVKVCKIDSGIAPRYRSFEKPFQVSNYNQLASSIIQNTCNDTLLQYLIVKYIPIVW